MILLKLTWQSLWNRRTNLLLTLLSITISIVLLLGVEYIRKEARNSFQNTLSGTDLVVGARSGSIQLLLYSVFRIGDATNNIDWGSYQHFAQHPKVDWAIPLSLGDSHKGYRVIGTNQDYFKHYRYGKKQNLAFTEGQAFNNLFDVVLGDEVAERLGYKIGDQIVLSHGSGATSFSQHDDKPFTIVGILHPTGTPVDRSLHVSLEAIEAIHLGWQQGAPIRGLEISAEKVASMNLKPQVITAFLVGLNQRTYTFRLQREINQYKVEPLLAIVPAVALSDMWRTIGQFEVVLRIITVFVVIASLLSMLTTLLSTLNERRREMAILRSVGAHPWQIVLLFLFESAILIALGIIFGVLLLSLSISSAQGWISAEYGVFLEFWKLGQSELSLLGIIALSSLLLSLIPGWIAYRNSLQDGLTIKI